jgi:hypothetical protein
MYRLLPGLPNVLYFRYIGQSGSFSVWTAPNKAVQSISAASLLVDVKAE